MTQVKKNFDQSNPAPKVKKSKKLWWGLGGFLVILCVMLYFHTPQAGITYGVCKVYIELNEPYPEDLKYLSLFDAGKYLEIKYRKVDPFGVISINTARCVFREENGAITPYLSSFDLNGKYRKYQAESPDKVKLFNNSVPAIVAHPPNLDIPFFPFDDISAYRSFFDSQE